MQFAPNLAAHPSGAQPPNDSKGEESINEEDIMNL